MRDAVFTEESWNPDTIEDMDEIVAAPANERKYVLIPLLFSCVKTPSTDVTLAS